MSKHTSGPWIIGDSIDKDTSERFLSVWPENLSTPAICRVSPKKDETDLDFANAKLIAAAPDLLEACQALLKRNEQLYRMVEYPREDMSGETSLQLAKAAIKKATS